MLSLLCTTCHAYPEEQLMHRVIGEGWRTFQRTGRARMRAQERWSEHRAVEGLGPGSVDFALKARGVSYCGTDASGV